MPFRTFTLQPVFCLPGVKNACPPWPTSQAATFRAHPVKISLSSARCSEDVQNRSVQPAIKQYNHQDTIFVTYSSNIVYEQVPPTQRLLFTLAQKMLTLKYIRGVSCSSQQLISCRPSHMQQGLWISGYANETESEKGRRFRADIAS